MDLRQFCRRRRAVEVPGQQTDQLLLAAAAAATAARRRIAAAASRAGRCQRRRIIVVALALALALADVYHASLAHVDDLDGEHDDQRDADDRQAVLRQVDARDARRERRLATRLLG